MPHEPPRPRCDLDPLERDAQNPDSTLDAVLQALAFGPPAPRAMAERARVPAALAAGREALVRQLTEAEVRGREPQVGELLDGRFRIERTLGRGGMGVVFAATNLRTGKSVAIKWIARNRALDAASAQAAAARLRREARAAGRIHHPNVVDLVDVGGTDEAPFLVMELLEGESLASRMSRGRLAWDEARTLLLPLLSGVAAAHAAGVVHRDLKPDNLFLCGASNGAITPKVLDFGVAAMRGTSELDTLRLTRDGAVIGTPAYMPLEQLTGGEIDARTDVYALCVVLYEAVTGELPYRAQNGSELAVQLATTKPTPASHYVAALRGAPEVLLQKGLERSPEARFQSVAELASALVAIELGKPTSRTPRFALALTLALAATWLGVRALTGKSPVAGHTRSPAPVIGHVGTPAPSAERALAPSTEPVDAGARTAAPAPESSPTPDSPPTPSRSRASHHKPDPKDLRIEDF